MNKENLETIHKTYEVQARYYCERVGIDPDERIPMMGMRPKIAGVPAPIVKVERWRLIADELFDFSVRLVALQQKPKVIVQ